MDHDFEPINYPKICINNELILPQFVEMCEELVCSICLNIVWNPVVCGVCTSPFGGQCLEAWFKRDKKCPKQCNFIKAEMPALSRRMMSKIQFNCINKYLGCNQVILYENFYNHVSACPYSFKCPNQGCDVKGLKENIISHKLYCKLNNRSGMMQMHGLNLVGSADKRNQNDGIYWNDSAPMGKNINTGVSVSHISESPFANHMIYGRCPDDFSKYLNKLREYAVIINRDLMHNNADFFKTLITSKNDENPGGLLYRDNNLEIEVEPKLLSKGQIGLLISFVSITDASLENLAVGVINFPEISIQCSKPKYVSNTNAQVLIKISVLDSFSNPPGINFRCNLSNGVEYNNQKIALPILITSFIEKSSLKKSDFFSTWRKYSDSSEDHYHKFDSIVSNPFNGKKSIMEFLKKIGSLLYCFGFIVYRPEDTKHFHEIEGAGKFVSGDAEIPILFQMSFLPSYPQEFRFSIRAKSPDQFKYISLTLDLFSAVDFFVNFKK